MFGLPSWLLIVPVLAALVFVHELGHYLAAKRFGIKVLEFGFGFPPRLFGVKYGETVYSINAIPLGGFVRLLGEEDPTDPRSFARQSVLKRTVVLCAGSFMNFLTPIVIFTVLFILPQDVPVGTVHVTGVAPGSPAQQAGIRAGDQVTAVDGKRVRNHYELVEQIMVNLGAEVELTVRRGSVVTGLRASPDSSVVDVVTVVPRMNPPELEVVEIVTSPETQVSLRDARRYNVRLQPGDTMTQGAVGVMIGTSNVRLVKESQSVLDASQNAVGRMMDILVLTKNSFHRWAVGGPDPGLTGPIGIAQITGEVAEAGIAPFFELVAIISISLGLINILPIPALDGGRLMFVLIEWARRGRRISPQREGLVHVIGFAVLIGLIIVVSFFDISRILSGDSIIR
jgi:regulator of sigma E protease